MDRIYTCLISVFLLFPFFGSSQKTFFIRAERDTQIVLINNVLWDKSPFFTLESNDELYQVQIKEPNYKHEYDILHEVTNYVFDSKQSIRISEEQLAKVKIVELRYDREMEVPINELDYTSYQKDLMHNGTLSELVSVEEKPALLSKIKLSETFLNQLSNNYHNQTIGRYKFYVGSTIMDVNVFKVQVSENAYFLQVAIDCNWSFVNNNMEFIGTFSHPGLSGKFAYNPALKGTKNLGLDDIDSIQNVSFENAFNLAIHDALLSSFLYFLDDNQEKIALQE